MENSSNLFADFNLGIGSPDRVSQLREEWRMTRAVLLELQEMGKPTVNLLLTGLDIVIRNVLQVLMPDLRKPVTIWRQGEWLVLPPVTKSGTLILQDVGTLARDDQRRLLEWTRAASRTQVVSTTRSSLLPRVQAGAFIDTLYNRLNTVSVNVTE
jgi:hypothetical protein